MLPLPVETIDAADEAPPVPRPTQEIPYEPTTSVSRRQFRFLLALTLINTLMLGAFVAGPGIARMTGGWWQDYKQWQADRLTARQRAQAQQKFAEAFKAGAQFTAPENYVVYEEDPERAATLKARDADFATVRASGYVYFTPKPRQGPVYEVSSKVPPPFQTSQAATAFIHARKTPAGIERVVVVRFRAGESIRSDAAVDGERRFSVRNERLFTASSYQAATDDAREGRITELAAVQPERKGTAITWKKNATWENGDIQVVKDDIFRLFAGHPDSNDASHFTIGYELDGASGIIDGWLLEDETVRLQPRLGRIIWDDGSGRARRWDPYAAPAAPPASPAVK